MQLTPFLFVILSLLTAFPTRAAPWNDECQGAIDIEPNYDQVIRGDIQGAAVLTDTPLCETNNHDPLLSGVWYRFNGTGQKLHAWFCHVETSFAPVVTLLGGSSCNDLQCVKEQSSVGWNYKVHCDMKNGEMRPFCFDTKPGQTYYLHVGTTFDETAYYANDTCKEDEGCRQGTFGMTLSAGEVDCGHNAYAAPQKSIDRRLVITAVVVAVLLATALTAAVSRMVMRCCRKKR